MGDDCHVCDEILDDSLDCCMCKACHQVVHTNCSHIVKGEMLCTTCLNEREAPVTPIAKQPCKECPFAKTKCGGWLGGYSGADELHQLTRTEARMPCHSHVDYDADEDEVKRQENKAPTCVGMLAYASHTAKHYRDPRVEAERKQVGKRDDVWKSPAELKKHHGR